MSAPSLEVGRNVSTMRPSCLPQGCRPNVAFFSVKLSTMTWPGRGEDVGGHGLTADADVRQLPVEAGRQLKRPNKLAKAIAVDRILERLLGGFEELEVPRQSIRFGVRYQLVELGVQFIGGVGVVELHLARAVQRIGFAAPA